MAERQRAGADPEKRHEAENLAREAVQELEGGDKAEGKFLAQEARELDRAAAEAVLKDEEHQKGAKSSRHAGNAKPDRASRSHRSSGSSPKGSERRPSHGGEKRDGSAIRSVDHDEIRAWVEERGGRPSVVRRSHDTGDGGGILRIDFAEPDESLEKVDWDEFFETFEDRQLAFLHQDRTAEGEVSRFFKFVRRDAEE